TISELSRFHGAPGVQVEGVVLNDPNAAGEATRIRLSVERVRWDQDKAPWAPTDATALVTIQQNVELVEIRERPFFRYGDRLMLTGTLEPPPELDDFDYPALLARQGVDTVMSFPRVELVSEGEGLAFYRWLFETRHRLSDSLALTVPEPEASFGQAVLLGIRYNLPDDITESFRASGTSHILAISGLHVGVLLGIGLALSAVAFGRRYQVYLIAPLLLIWGYTLIAGASPSVVRAAIMGTAFLGALAVGRPRSTMPALALAAALMVAVDPRVLFSVSFQLSFAAMTGIALFYEPLSDSIQAGLGVSQERESFFPVISRLIVDSASITIVATLATLPLVGFYFEQVSLVGLPATMLSMLAIPLALVSHALAASIGLFSETAAQPFSWVAWVSSAYVVNVSSVASRYPGAVWQTGNVAYYWVVGYYGVIVVLTLVRTQRRRMPSSSQMLRAVDVSGWMVSGRIPWQVVVVTLAMAGIAWTAVLTQPDGRLRVVFADVGQGDMTVITTPGGHRIVVDGGPDAVRAARVMSDSLRFWERSLDLVILTHPHSDHVVGLTEILRRYDVKRILQRDFDIDSAQNAEWRQAVSQEGASMLNALPGQVIAFDDGVFIEILGPPDVLLTSTTSDIDNASVAIRLVYGSVSFMLAGDTFRVGERLMIRNGTPIESNVLKAAHHGSRSSSAGDFISAVSPDVVVISAGPDNRFGHPHQETLDTLAQRVPGSPIYVTRDHGSITVISDGKTLSVDSQRRPLDGSVVR
ncbi:MAG: DNA internalization-related competence protein ComEC/Rec2, partial [SAR202 cluster bacterium]|nr:DNA internalization-related competence protein ComEC/Rec2 [SAR202 cluster bacterium]